MGSYGAHVVTHNASLAERTVPGYSLSWLFLQPRPHILGIVETKALQTL